MHAYIHMRVCTCAVRTPPSSPHFLPQVPQPQAARPHVPQTQVLIAQSQELQHAHAAHVFTSVPVTQWPGEQKHTPTLLILFHSLPARENSPTGWRLHHYIKPFQPWRGLQITSLCDQSDFQQKQSSELSCTTSQNLCLAHGFRPLPPFDFFTNICLHTHTRIVIVTRLHSMRAHV